MNRLLPLALLAAVVAVSGCTTENGGIATQGDLNDQTQEINHHTERVVEQASKPVTKYNITEIDVEASCSTRDDHGQLTGISSARVELFERAGSGVQSFDNRKPLIINGIEEVDAEVVCHNRSHDEARISVDTVTFEKSVYQQGSQVASGTNRCELYEDVDLWDDPTEESEFAEHMAEKIYDQCFGVDYRGENR